MDLSIKDLSDTNISLLFDWSGETKCHDAGCRHCLYWEEPDRRSWPEGREPRLGRKREWFKRVTSEFGVCGKIAFDQSEAVGYAQFAPSHYLPNSEAYLCGPPSGDAVFISCLYVHRKSGQGIGSALLSAVIEDLSERNVKAIETYARKDSSNNPTGPLGFWIGHGFRVIGEDQQFALVRLDLADGNGR